MTARTIIVATGQIGPPGPSGGGTSDVDAINDLSDVTITAPAVGDLIRFDGTAWVDAPGSTYFDVSGTAAAVLVSAATDATAKVSAHEADTTSVHGIADTSLLETLAGAATKANAAQAAAIAAAAADATSKVATHEADTTSVHGITNTALLETTTGSQAKVDTHVNDTSAAHAASAVSFAPAGTIAGTDVQAAVVEVASEGVAALAAHVVASDPHGDRAYADAQIAASTSTAFDLKASVRVATTANITLSGAQTIDGVSVVATDRVLVKDQSTGSQNGLYVAAAGAWSRATDADIDAEVTAGIAVRVNEGTANDGKFFVLTTPNPITVGSTALTFDALSSGGDMLAANNLSDLTSASTARTNLALVIGTNVQAFSSVLAATTASFLTADETKLDAIEAGATADMTAAEILTAIKTVDGTGSGLDADLLDGSSSAAFAAAVHTHTASSVTDFNAAVDARVSTSMAFAEGITGAYDDGTDTLTLSGDPLWVRSSDVDYIVKVTQAQYNALTPDADTLYEISDATGGGANLVATLGPTTIVVTSDTGTDATLPLADGTNAGLMPPAAASRIYGKKATGNVVALTGAEAGALIALDELAAPTDITTRNATTTAHGLLQKLNNVATQYMNGQGNWTTPAGGGGGGGTVPTVPRSVISSVRLAIPGVNFNVQASSAAQVASRMCYMPIWVDSEIVMDAMYTEIVTVNSATVCRMGVYNSDNAWQPTTLVYDYGTVNPATVGVKITTTHTLTLTENTPYLLAWVSDGTPVYRAIRGWFKGMTIDPGMGAGMIPQKFHKGGVGTGALASTSTGWDTVATSTVGFEWACMVRVTSV